VENWKARAAGKPPNSTEQNDLLPGFRCCCIRGFLLIAHTAVAHPGRTPWEGRAQAEPFIPAPPRLLPPDNDARVGAGFPGGLKKESGTLSRSVVVFAELVVLRVHGGPAADLVAHKPQLRRDAVDISDLAGVARIARGKAALRAASASTNGLRSSKRFDVMRLIGRP
jgi:antitoxin (DNA-binding transcriptional repressor) of toxin-antitoxin stability system